MPWTVKDVDSKKKGLTDKQKRKWVNVANSVRKECLENGGDEKTCDAKAIRQANGVVNNTEMLTIHSEVQTSYTTEIRTFDGKEYLVVPVVMMVEGVHNGSHGAIYHTPEEFGKIEESWNGIPVTISHPRNEDGQNVSANSPDVLENWAVGKVFNTRFENNKLKAQAWLDTQKLTAISPESFEKIQSGEILEVSVGLFSEEEQIQGYWNNEQYNAIARNYRPDHLALLPGEVGACSVEKGCGVRVNKKGGNNVNLGKIFKDLSKKGFSVSPMTNEVSFSEIMNQLYTLMDGKDSENEHFYLEDVYENYVVYRKRQVNSQEGKLVKSEDLGLFKQNYQIGANNKVEFVGDPVEVKREVSYTSLSEKVNNNNEKEVKMACETCAEKAKELIANSATHFEDSDLEWLSDLSEDKLDKMIPKRVRTNKDEKEEKSVTLDEAKAVIQANMKGDDLIGLLPEELKNQYDVGVKIYKEQRENVIKSILDNTEKDTWTKEELDGMKLDVLKKLEKSVKKTDVENYSGMGAGSSNNDDGDRKVEPMPIPGVEFKTK